MSQIKYLPDYNLSYINSPKLRKRRVGRELDDVVTHLPGGHSWFLEKLEHTFVTVPLPVKTLSDPVSRLPQPSLAGGGGG